MKKLIIILGVTISLVLISIGVYGLIMSGDLSFLNNNSTNNKENDENNNGNENVTFSISDLQSAMISLKNANNFSEGIKTTSSIESDNMEANIKVDLIRQEDETLLLVKGEIAMHTYTVLEEEKLVTYSLISMFGINEWIKSTEETSSNYDKSYLDVILDNTSLFSPENNTFKALLPKELAKEIYNSDDATGEILGDIPIEIKLSNDKNIETIVFDYSNNIKFDNNVVDSYVVAKSFSNIGNTKIVVPDDVKNSAKAS